MTPTLARSVRIAWLAILAGALAALALATASCGGGGSNAALYTDDGSASNGSINADLCSTPNTGCPCSQEGATAGCGQLGQQIGNYKFCTAGQRTCTSGQWSDCEAAPFVPNETALEGRRLATLGGQQTCADAGSTNYCDPACMVNVDTPSGIDAGTGFAINDAGLGLLATTGSGIGCSQSPVVTPTPQTITVSSLCSARSFNVGPPTANNNSTCTTSAVTTTPASLTFTAKCGATGATLSPSWTISNYQPATISSGGVFTVYSPIGGPDTVTATSGTSTGTGTANIVVAVNELGKTTGGTAVTAATALLFNATGLLADTNLTVLYPYNNTVFPLGLAAPTLQWDDKSTAAAYIKVSLRYPPKSVTMNQTFSWSIVLPGEPDGTVVTAPYTHAPAYVIPQDVWTAFSQSASGANAEIVLQRMITAVGPAYLEKTIPVSFATAPLSGTVYYTQYLRNLTNVHASDSTQTNLVASTYKIGGACPIGNGTHVTGQGSQVYAVNPGSAGSPVDPFNGQAGCPVCHSLSANGKTFISVDLGIDQQYGGGHPVKVGLDTIGAGGVFTQLADAPDFTGGSGPAWGPPPGSGDGSRGFSYNAITPDGRYNLQAMAFWGNGNDAPSGTTFATVEATQNNVLSANNTWNIYDLSSGTPTKTTATGLTISGTPLGMLTPSFSPDGTKLVYVNADSGPASWTTKTGWKKGISMASFTETTKTFGTPVLLQNHWTAGSTTNVQNPMKWPVFEDDSRSLLFVQTEAQEYCVYGSNDIHDANSGTSVGCYQSSYGNMSPTTRSMWNGDLYSMDTNTPLGTPVALANINEGPYGRTDNGAVHDEDMAYQPSALPFASGGYRWVIFTSQRAYGNQANPYDYVNGVATSTSCSASQLWMAAIDDATSGATVTKAYGGTSTDRSYPAFWLPNQRYAALTANHYINEHGYLVPAACATTGTGTASVCNTNSDCCNNTCRIDLPVSSPPTRHCAAASGTCSQAGGSCSTSADCCNSVACVNGSCSAAPTYPPATYTQTFSASCNTGQHVVWHLLYYTASIPGNADIVFAVQTDTDAAPTVFQPSTPITIETATAPSGASPSSDVDTLLRANSLVSGPQLTVSMTFNPTTPGNLATPTLSNWTMTFDCSDTE